MSCMSPRSDKRLNNLHASVWDMDGTLLRTDVFAESVVRVAIRKPWLLLFVCLWLLRGRAYCKGRVATIAEPMWDEWPLRESAVALIASDRLAGKSVLLATAAHSRVATRVAEAVGLFDGVVSSTDERNLKGQHKLAAIQEWISECGCAGFSYGGDSKADLPIWAAADEAVLVAPSLDLERRVRAMKDSVTVLDARGDGVHPLVSSLRPYQWSKNVLVFVPMIVGGRFDLVTLFNTGIAFVVFCLAASATYVLNDLSDLPSDRQHPAKRLRPFASGAVSVQTGVVLVLVLFGIALLVSSLTMPVGFSLLIAGYVAANALYSGFLKQRPIFDVTMLAAMYGLRLEAGGLAGCIDLSPWLLAFSLFFFTSLAFAKRYAELHRLAKSGIHRAAGRGYMVGDMETLLALGAASGYMAVLVLVLYMNSQEMRAMYGSSRLLWLICPFVMYWITRVWLFARRGTLGEDPVVFAFRDRMSLVVGAICAGLLIAATWLR